MEVEKERRGREKRKRVSEKGRMEGEKMEGGREGERWRERRTVFIMHAQMSKI